MQTLHKRTKAHRNTPLESRRGQSAPRGCVVARPGWVESPQTPERWAASSAAQAGTLRLLPHDWVWEGRAESQGGRGWDGAYGESQEGWGVSRWLMSQLLLPHSWLVPGSPVYGAVRQAERWEADPSWHKETACPHGPQWTDWTTKTGDSRVTHGFIWTKCQKYNSLLIQTKKERSFFPIYIYNIDGTMATLQV